jgi:hypothetical protein
VRQAGGGSQASRQQRPASQRSGLALVAWAVARSRLAAWAPVEDSRGAAAEGQKTCAVAPGRWWCGAVARADAHRVACGVWPSAALALASPRLEALGAAAAGLG